VSIQVDQTSPSAVPAPRADEGSSVEERGCGGWVRLTVEDSGPGMPPELLATATERFARSVEARSRPGSGLGLALVAILVQDAGGELRLCYAGHHEHTGRGIPVPCRHGEAMTVTVLLPAAGATQLSVGAAGH
jgi:signal transduction histidine kinase